MAVSYKEIKAVQDRQMFYVDKPALLEDGSSNLDTELDLLFPERGIPEVEDLRVLFIEVAGGMINTWGENGIHALSEKFRETSEIESVAYPPRYKHNFWLDIGAEILKKPNETMDLYDLWFLGILDMVVHSSHANIIFLITENEHPDTFRSSPESDRRLEIVRISRSLLSIIEVMRCQNINQFLRDKTFVEKAYQEGKINAQIMQDIASYIKAINESGEFDTHINDLYQLELTRLESSVRESIEWLKSF